MKILINASSLKVGGGLQVADSIVHELKNLPEHSYIAVVPSKIFDACSDANAYGNVKVLKYDMPTSFISAVTGKDLILDKLVTDEEIDAVLTVFGPSRWRPQVPHLCGFARPQLVIPESPFWKEVKGVQRLKSGLRKAFNKWQFRVGTDNLWTENSFISDRVKKLYPAKKVFTVTNNYNQVFDDENLWDNSVKLPAFDGFTLLTISANYPHKNLGIIRSCIEWLGQYHPEFKYRFVLTLNEDQFPLRSDAEKEHILLIGPVAINQVPNLYRQADVMFLPTLLECFSASYAEAMKMKVPILTTDLGFAHSICGDAACYFSPTSVSDIGEKLHSLATDPTLSQKIVDKGLRQLGHFDTAAQRARKLINITSELAKNK